jgi:hypothetical protein
MKRILFGIFAVLVLLSLVVIPFFIPDAPSKYYYLNIQRPVVIAH